MPNDACPQRVLGAQNPSVVVCRTARRVVYESGLFCALEISGTEQDNPLNAEGTAEAHLYYTYNIVYIYIYIYILLGDHGVHRRHVPARAGAPADLRLPRPRPLLGGLSSQLIY